MQYKIWNGMLSSQSLVLIELCTNIFLGPPIRSFALHSPSLSNADHSVCVCSAGRGPHTLNTGVPFLLFFPLFKWRNLRARCNPGRSTTAGLRCISFCLPSRDWAQGTSPFAPLKDSHTCYRKIAIQTKFHMAHVLYLV